MTFPKAKLAVYVDGCFWHCCPSHYVEPKTKCRLLGDQDHPEHGA